MSPAGTKYTYTELYGDELLLTQEEFTFLAGIHLETLKLWRRKGRVREVKVGRGVLIPASELCRISQ